MQNQNIKPLELGAIDPATYSPNGLIDGLIRRLNLKNDAALCRVLEVTPPTISKIRHRKLTVGASMLICIQDKTGIPINEARRMAGLPIPKFGAAA